MDRMFKPRRSAVFAAAVVSPVLLSGCAFPVGIQVASLLADGVSLLTTEKTLADHGLSAMAQDDCSLWRGLTGGDVCGIEDTPTTDLASADARTWALTDAPDTDDDADAALPTLSAQLQHSPVQVTASPSNLFDPDTEISSDPGPLAEMQSPAPVVVSERVVPAVAATSAETSAAVAGGTFYVIASYRSAGYAQRFIEARKSLGARVLNGTARGRPVYRVAVGPVAKPQRATTRRRLVDAGFTDTWPVNLSAPTAVVELASID